MNVSPYFVATSSSAASSPIASKSLGMCGALGKPGRRMDLEASSFDAASASQVGLYLGGLKEEQQGNLTHEKEQISEESDDSESEPWCYKLVAQTDEACGKPLAGETAESISSAFQKVKTIKKRRWNTSSPYRLKQSLVRKPSTTWSGRSTEDHQAILWRIWT